MGRSVLLRTLLPLTLPASWLYRFATVVHNSLFEAGLLKIHRLPQPVISVGNLTVGGSGKTPLVAFVSRYWIERGQSVAVLSRGYRRRDSEAFRIVSDGRDILADVGEGGDEPIELARSVSGLVVAVGADRFRVGMEVVRGFAPQIFILDDGFQHRRLFRSLDLVCIDASEPVADLRLLPAGRLREPLTSLNRASGLVWTRWRQGLPSERLASSVMGVFREPIPVFRASQDNVGFTRLDAGAETLPPDALKAEPVGVLAAIARPTRFVDDVRAAGARVVWSATRRDHHRWHGEEVARLLEKARRHGARAAVTTGKDAVKMRGLPGLPLPLYRMDVRMEIVERRSFQELMSGVLLTK